MKAGTVIAWGVAAANLLLILLFPPFDYLSLERGGVPTFDGFRFALGDYPNRRINTSFLSLEAITILLNLFIALLLIGDARRDQGAPRRANWAQRLVLVGVGVNLVLMLLFPPFENFIAISKATLPSFEGFFLVFGQHTDRQIVMPILFLEVGLLLSNGAMLWLMLRKRAVAEREASLLQRFAGRLH